MVKITESMYVHMLTFNMSLIITVPNSINVSVTAPNTQIIGQSLILECSLTTVRGITSRIDIEWSSGNIILQMIEGIGHVSSNSSVLYKTIYNITEVSTLDDDRIYQCKVVINTNPQLTATDSITLDVTGNNLEINNM